MRSRWRNLGAHGGPALWWFMPSAVLMMILLYVSFLQDPSVTPLRESHEERAPARPPAPMRDRRTLPAERTKKITTVRGHAGTSGAVSSPSPQRKKTGDRAGGATPEPMKATAVPSREPRSTQGQGRRGTEPSRELGKAAPTARTPAPGSRGKAQPPLEARPTRRGNETRVTVTTKARAKTTKARAKTTKARAKTSAARAPARSPKDVQASSGPVPGDEYRMDAGIPPTTCPGSLKVKAAASSWLGSLFLPNVTLFLDSEHLDPEEWERLRRYNPPFGFLELNRSLVQSVVAHFPPGPPRQLLAGLARGNPPCVRCAVVGNGGSLNGSRKGQEIDGHDYVFRVNGALTRGFERDVGNRTSFYGFTAFSLTTSMASLGRRGFPHAPQGKDVHYLHFLENSRDYTWLQALLLDQPLRENKLAWFRRRPREAFPDDFSLDRYHLLHPDVLRYMKNRFLRSKTLDSRHWRLYRPTTGALLLLTALQLCDQVSAYGFITEGHSRFSDHYFDLTWKKTVFYINHDFNLEKQLWKRLHEEGIIQLYQRR